MRANVEGFVDPRALLGTRRRDAGSESIREDADGSEPARRSRSS
jgi:hypothetical protein